MSLLNIIIAFFIIRFIVKLFSGNHEENRDSTRGYSSRDNRQDFFTESMLKVLAAAMKADGRVTRSELDVVKSVLISQFGEEGARPALLRLRDILKTDIDIRMAAMSIGSMVSYNDRLRLAEILCQIAKADGIITDSEVQTIVNISYYMGLSSIDTQRIAARLHVNGNERGNQRGHGGYGNGNQSSASDLKNAYSTLGIKPDVTNAEVKDAYRNMVKKYHPDRFATQGAEAQAKAEQKFKDVQAAYEKIKTARGL